MTTNEHSPGDEPKQEPVEPSLEVSDEQHEKLERGDHIRDEVEDLEIGDQTWEETIQNIHQHIPAHVETEPDSTAPIVNAKQLQRLHEAVEDTDMANTLLRELVRTIDEFGAEETANLLQELRFVGEHAETALVRQKRIDNANKGGAAERGGRPSKVERHLENVARVLNTDYSNVADVYDKDEADVRAEQITEKLEDAKQDMSRATFYKLKSKLSDDLDIDTTDYVDNPSQ